MNVTPLEIESREPEGSFLATVRWILDVRSGRTRTLPLRAGGISCPLRRCSVEAADCRACAAFVGDAEGDGIVCNPTRLTSWPE